MSKKKSKSVSRPSKKSVPRQSKKKSTRKTTSSKRHHPAPNESELDRTGLAYASLYAEIYLRRKGIVLDAPVDGSWKDVPVLRMQNSNSQVTVRWLEKHDSFGVAVPANYSEDSGVKIKGGLEWLTFLPDLAEGSTLTRDLLLALDWTPRYLGIFGGYMRYEFFSAKNEADSQTGLRDLIHHEIRSYRGKRSKPKRFRPVFPAPDGFELIAFGQDDLPAWALKENWLVKNLIVSPVEFRRTRNGLDIETSNLPDYVSWVLSRKCSDAHYGAETIKAEVRKEIHRFIELLLQAEGESDFVFSRNGQSNNQQFLLEETARIMGL